MISEPFAFTVAPVTGPGFLFDGNRLARDHRFVNAARASRTTPSTGSSRRAALGDWKPTRTCSSGKSVSDPSAVPTRAVFGAQSEKSPDGRHRLAFAPSIPDLPREQEFVIAAAARSTPATPPVSSRKDAGKAPGSRAAIRL